MNGIFLVDKPQGFTSHDVVDYFRRRFGLRKVGHAGTLDPMATGLLVILVGSATKHSGSFLSDDKEYEGVVRLGIRTDTHDGLGKIISEGDISEIAEDVVKNAFKSFLGKSKQIPPMVSALKRRGQRLYKLARKGIVVKLEPRAIEIYSINVKAIDLPEVSFSVHCSKGTYVRKLAEDIGLKLGCGGHLASLRRTRSGDFSVVDSLTLENLEILDRDALEKYLRRIE